MSESDFHDTILHASAWLEECALPFWASVGVDGKYGFVEQLALDGSDSHADFKRLRVQARQVYVYSHAYLNGYSPGLDAAANGWTFMRKHGWQASRKWARVLGRGGGVVDPTADLYDHAFALLAIAWWIRASGEDATSWAERTLEAIDHFLATSDGVGWWSEEGPGGVLLQNPHMHLFEACLAAYATTGLSTFRAYAHSILSLFDRHLFDPRTGTVAEYFEADWRFAEESGCRIVEPGHHYEWVWLLCSASRWFPDSTAHVASLFDFAERFGCDPVTRLVYDRVYADGSVALKSHRLWPNTEALKAHLARFEYFHRIDFDNFRQILENLFLHYLGRPTAETWIDQLDGSCLPAVSKIPTSTMYHIHLALTELGRLGPHLHGAGLLS